MPLSSDHDLFLRILRVFGAVDEEAKFIPKLSATINKVHSPVAGSSGLGAGTPAMWSIFRRSLGGRATLIVLSNSTGKLEGPPTPAKVRWPRDGGRPRSLLATTEHIYQYPLGATKCTHNSNSLTTGSNLFDFARNEVEGELLLPIVEVDVAVGYDGSCKMY